MEDEVVVFLEESVLFFPIKARGFMRAQVLVAVEIDCELVCTLRKSTSVSLEVLKEIACMVLSYKMFYVWARVSRR